MKIRSASCSCGALRVHCTGEPIRISMCHCLACQRRTGAPFSAQSRFNRDRIAIEGDSTTYKRIGDSGNTVTFHFCPVCASTVYWGFSQNPDVIAVALGMFADPLFPKPMVVVYEGTKHAWTDDIAALSKPQTKAGSAQIR